MANEYLKRTPTSSGNRKVWTWSCWVKRNEISNGSIFYTSQTSTPFLSVASFNANNTLQAVRSESGTVTELNSESVFRDVGSWKHILISFDTTKSTESERTKLYVNGVLVPFNSSANYASLNYDAAVNRIVEHHIGIIRNTGSTFVNPFLGELFDLFLVDGQALTPDVFGFYQDGDGYISAGSTQATDFRPGQWSPRLPKSIKYTINRRGGFGVNGFYLPMNDSSNPGADFHTTPNSIIKLKGEDLPQPRNGAPTTSDAYVSQLRQEVATLGFDGAVKFDGDGDYLSLSTTSDFAFGTGDFTIEFWAWIESSQSSTLQPIFDNDYNSAGGLAIAIRHSDSRIFLGDNGSGLNLCQFNAPFALNSWNHFAVVADSGTYKAFVNGTSCSLGLGSATVANTSRSSGTTEIGRLVGQTSLDAAAFISNLRVVKGTALYTANFTAPTEPLTNVTNTKLLCCNSSTSATAATVTPGTITANGNAFATRNELTGSIVLACPFVAGGFGQDGAVSSTIPGLGDYHIALGGPSSIPAVNILIGSGNQAQVTGDKGLYYGSSLDLSDSSISPRATVGTAFTPDGDYTVEFWAYQNDLTGASGAHLIQYDQDNGNTGWLISSDLGTFRWMLRNSSNQDVQVSTPNVIKSGQWNHFAGVYESSKNLMTAYLNGVAVGSTPVPSNYISTQYTSLNRIHIGSNGGNTSRPMLGYMSDLRIYKGVAKYTGGFDVPKPYTPVGIESWRTTADTCKNNFATLNPLFAHVSSNTYTNGNLKAVATTNDQVTTGNMAFSSGKWYWETRIFSDEMIGLGIPSQYIGGYPGQNTNGFSYHKSGSVYYSGTTSYGSGWAANTYHVIGIAVDWTNKRAYWHVDGVWANSADPSAGTGFYDITTNASNVAASVDAIPAWRTRSGTASEQVSVNFGQNQTFANLKAVNKNRINSSTADSVWHQSSNGGAHTNWTVASGGTELDVAVPSGHYARVKLRSADGTIDLKKKYLLSFKYTTGPANLGIQNDQGYMTAVDGSAAPSGLSSGNWYSFIIHGTSEVSITGFTGSTYALDNVIVSEIDECYTDDSGIGKFHYQPPTGFLALCEDNLPTPAIADPGEHFKIVLYENKQKVSGVGFKPDLIWTKSRNQLYSHYLYDSVRGVGGIGLNSDNAGLEGTNDAGGILSFDDDGFTWSTDAGLSQTEAVAWCWKAGGAAVSNTDGTITSQVSANQTAGFSIVSYTGNGNTNQTVGHGLNKKPSLVIYKDRDSTNEWRVIPIFMNDGHYLSLSTPAARITTSTSYFGTNTSSVLGITGSNSGIINTNTNKIIAYCWAEIENYSKFGIYSGNDSANGSFIYCGFKPALVMTKRFDSNSNWLVHDSSRDPVNPVMGTIWGNLNNIESRSNVIIDMLSNGFKHRNADGGTGNNRGLPAEYIFIAFAESPFQTANAK